MIAFTSNRTYRVSNHCYKMDYNPYSLKNHHYASTKFGTWRMTMDGRKTQNENENHGNAMTSGGGDGTRFGKIRKNTQFRNRNVKKVNRFNNGGGVRFQPYVAARKARVIANLTEPDVVAAAADSMIWGEFEKDLGLDVYGTMSGLIRLKSNGSDGMERDEIGLSSSGTDEDAEHVQFERRLNKYEIVLQNGVSVCRCRRKQRF